MPASSLNQKPPDAKRMLFRAAALGGFCAFLYLAGLTGQVKLAGRLGNSGGFPDSAKCPCRLISDDYVRRLQEGLKFADFRTR